MPTAPTYAYTNRSWMESLLSIDGVSLRTDDDGDGALNARESAYLMDQAINVATERVNGYLIKRYNPVDLVTSYEVWDWTTLFACRWLCHRRGNPIPESTQLLYDEALEALKEVRSGKRDIANAAPADEEFPVYSNMELDPRYWLRKLRVQRGVSSSDRGPAKPPLPSRWAEQIREEY